MYFCDEIFMLVFGVLYLQMENITTGEHPPVIFKNTNKTYINNTQ